jgi:hypothetical protein
LPTFSKSKVAQIRHFVPSFFRAGYTSLPLQSLHQPLPNLLRTRRIRTGDHQPVLDDFDAERLTVRLEGGSGGNEGGLDEEGDVVGFAVEGFFAI